MNYFYGGAAILSGIVALVYLIRSGRAHKANQILRTEVANLRALMGDVIDQGYIDAHLRTLAMQWADAECYFVHCQINQEPHIQDTKDWVLGFKRRFWSFANLADAVGFHIRKSWKDYLTPNTPTGDYKGSQGIIIVLSNKGATTGIEVPVEYGEIAGMWIGETSL